MRSVLSQTAHRPWPLPAGPWIMSQNWENLLFAHWAVPAEALRRLIPSALEIDTFQGQAWLGVVPFAMRRVLPRYTFRVPGLSDFLELNVRTYVRRGDRPGVYFFSLEASNPIAVAVARGGYRLPYFNARMQMAEREGWIEYRSQRTHRGAPGAEFRGRYRPIGEVHAARPGTLEHWLTERYCLYTLDGRGQVYRGEIHHAPWPLQPAQAEIQANSMAAAAGLEIQGAPLLHFARCIETVEWPITPV